jgi:GNAT superfamily N-acetyltransferase
VIVRELTEAELPAVDARLPLDRLEQWREGNSVFLVAWDEGEPVGHALLEWPGPKCEDPSLPELQNVYVTPERRREGVATLLNAAAEEHARSAGFDELALTCSVDNAGALRAWERLGYRRSSRPTRRIKGTILLRGKPFDVDDTLAHFVKPLT